MAGINDLLPHVKGPHASSLHASNQQPRDQHGYDLEAGQPADFHTAAGQDMQRYFDKTREIQALMEQVKVKQRDLWKMHEQGKTIVRMKEITEHREQMQVRRAGQGAEQAAERGVSGGSRRPPLTVEQAACAANSPPHSAAHHVGHVSSVHISSVQLWGACRNAAGGPVASIGVGWQLQLSCCRLPQLLLSSALSLDACPVDSACTVPAVSKLPGCCK